MEHPYITHLSKEPFFKTILEGVVPREIARNSNIASFLYQSIISQQLSTRVGEVIIGRFMNIYDGIDPSPQQIIDTPIEALQAVGLSRSKAGYIKNVAQFAIDHGLDHDKLILLPDEEVISFVTQIKGIGQWTAQTLLMFGLGREDVFSADDLIIQNAMAVIFSLDKTDKKKFKVEIIRISADWSPYRTYACLHLWQWFHSR